MTSNITLETIQARQDELAAMIAAYNAAKQTINLPGATIELRAGEHYAGVVLHDDGTPSHHLVLMAARPGERLAWQDAKAEIAAAVAQERERCIGIIESHHIPVGNSAAGEMACEWTYDALKTIRDAIRAGAKEPSDG